jgi:hypothetical protein
VSTATHKTPAAGQSKSLASSKPFKTFAVVFGIGTVALYVLSDMAGLPLFTYHPATNRLEWFKTLPRQGEGPVMYWYGWTVSSILGAAALGLLAALLPENITRKIPLALVWIVPLLAIPLLFYTLMPFWTR